jgi:hypothetical protein
MNAKPTYKKLTLTPKQQAAMQAALKPVLKQLGLQPPLMSFSVAVARGGRLAIEFQQRQSDFTANDVELAIYRGKFPRGMTALDLAAFPADFSKRKNETALHLSLSKGVLPPKTTLTDLLECRSQNKRRAIYALFDDHKITPIFPTYLSARTLAAIKSSAGGSLLHKAALRGVYPRGTTVRDLLSPRNEFGMTPLHRAAQAGHLPPCTKADLQSVTNEAGRTPWSFAVDILNGSHDLESAVRNLLACPQLAERLRLDREPHREILDLLLASRKLTPELRKRFAIYPQVCAAML